MGSEYANSAANSHSHGAKPRFFSVVRRYAVPVLALAAVSTLAGFEVARLQGGAVWGSRNLVQAALLTDIPSSSGNAVDPSVNTFSRLGPQEQAEHLLERAITRDIESVEIIDKNIDSWRGHLQNTDRLFDLVHTALNSDDLRVRSSAVEIDLAANNLSKTPQNFAPILRSVHRYYGSSARSGIAASNRTLSSRSS
jgi:hypothetical protein